MDREKLMLHVKQGIDDMGIKVNDDFPQQLWIYLNFLLEENKKYNLTAITDPEEVIIRHFFDSLVVLKYINIKDEERYIDVGTGAGFPGMVLKLASQEMNLTLLDSLKKRINFLNLLIHKLNIEQINTIHGRAEELGQDIAYRESFHLVFSRAVAPLNILLEYCLPFCKEDGEVVLYKGPDYKQEIKEASRALDLLGGEVSNIKEVSYPGLKADRYLVFVKKVALTPDKYPRRPGIPKKRPL